MSDDKRANPYVLGLILAAVTIISYLADLFVNRDFNLRGVVISIITIVFGAIYSINPKTSNRKIIMLSYIITCVNSVISIIIYSQWEYNSESMMSPAELDNMRLVNMLNVFLVNLLPALLMLIGMLKPKKVFSIVVMTIETIVVLVTSYMSFSTIVQFGARSFILSSVTSMLMGLYALAIWYKVALSEFHKPKGEKNVVQIIEKEIVSTEFALKKLKEQYENGDISETEYTVKKNLIISKMLV